MNIESIIVILVWVGVIAFILTAIRAYFKDVTKESANVLCMCTDMNARIHDIEKALEEVTNKLDYTVNVTIPAMMEKEQNGVSQNGVSKSENDASRENAPGEKPAKSRRRASTRKARKGVTKETTETP